MPISPAVLDSPHPRQHMRIADWEVLHDGRGYGPADYVLAKGELRWRGRPVRPQAISRAAIMTVEGEHDDICGFGQTVAALDLCRSVPVTMRHHHLQTSVGHYGVFSGRYFAQ
ncbi:hypothetical protein [Rhodovarius crocodyli]|uniref:hypothetical protein n=1 Tax=Rhodovarius crocodyli TaxID=1979269 RepID=UPI001F0CD5F1|nr:hypothetical protein [Rhodovarius crocodyli]